MQPVNVFLNQEEDARRIYGRFHGDFEVSGLLEENTIGHLPNNIILNEDFDSHRTYGIYVQPDDNKINERFEMESSDPAQESNVGKISEDLHGDRIYGKFDEPDIMVQENKVSGRLYGRFDLNLGVWEAGKIKNFIRKI